MVNILLGQQGLYTKHPCFLCYSGSCATDQHWVKKNWPAREDLAVGDKNIVHEPLVNWDRIIMPLLHIKLVLMKRFVKALDKDGDCFNYIAKTFPGLSMEKIKAGIFDGPQIRKLMQDKTLSLSSSLCPLALFSQPYPLFHLSFYLNLSGRSVFSLLLFYQATMGSGTLVSSGERRG